MKSLDLSKYFEYVKPKYVYLKITPLKSLRNYNSDKILSIVSSLYRKFTNLIIKENNKLFFHAPYKIAYYIYMEHDKIEFYFIIPEKYESLLKERVNDVWKGVTIDNVNYLPLVDTDYVTYCLSYDKHDALSLATDKRNNVLLSSLTSTTSIMEQEDKVAVLYNFMPCSQYSWKSDFDNVVRRYKEGYPIERNKLKITFIMKILASIVLEILTVILNTVNDLLGGQTPEDKLTFGNMIELSNNTYKKRDLPIINTQIVVLSSSANIKQAEHNAIATCEAFTVVEEDNRLLPKRIHSCFNVDDYKISGANINKTSPLECQNFLSLPGKEIIEEHKISCINTLETEVPDELSNGYIRAGVSTFRGQNTSVFMCNDIELRNLPLCITGSNRSGKTTYLENITHDYLNHGECVIAFDFCGNCEFSNHLIKTFKTNAKVIDCADFDNLQGIGYNEIKPSDVPFIQYRNAKMQSIQLSTLLNSVNDDDKSLKAKMDRYLEAASLIVFINNGSVKDVFDVLQNHIKRAEFISKIPANQKENLSEYVTYLSELNEVDRNTQVTVGTVYRKIEGIIDRLNVLKRNTYVELMLKHDCTHNIDLYEEIQKNQLICIKMPENMFSTHNEKDVFCTYWFSKIWLTLQLRKNELPREQHTKVNILVDELYQVEKCQSLISQKLSQMPKFTAKLIVSCHYLNQISQLREELKACNSSYMILQGSNVSNFDSLKLEFTNLNYTVDDLLNLKRYHSLNLLSYEQGYWAGITALPKPLM